MTPRTIRLCGGLSAALLLTWSVASNGAQPSSSLGGARSAAVQLETTDRLPGAWELWRAERERPSALGGVREQPPTGGDPTTVLLQQDRFQVGVEWRRPPQFPAIEAASVSELGSDDSAIVYFLDPDNLELLIKVLDACAINDRFWVFFAATTDAEFTVTVTDLQENVTMQYQNILGRPADAVTDTAAFATCP